MTAYAALAQPPAFRQPLACVTMALVMLAAVLVALLGAPAGALAQERGPAEIAAALRSDPVFFDPRARPTIDAADAGRIRIRIVEKDLGRIKIAVVSQATASRAGGVKGLADAIDERLRAPGTLLVLAGDNAWVTTSYARPERAVTAVRRAFAGRGRLARQLLAAVNGIAAVDPGPSGDLQPSGQPIDADEIVETVQLIFWIVGGIIALPFLIGALLLVRRILRGRPAAPTPAPAQEQSQPQAQTRAAPADYDEQRQAAERAFGGDD